jgi:hypothetical protein
MNNTNNNEQVKPSKFTGIPRFRSSVRPTGEDIPLVSMKSCAEAAAMELRGKAFVKTLVRDLAASKASY